MEEIQDGVEHPDFDETYVENLLKDSYSKWKALKIEPLQVRSLCLLAEFNYRAGDDGLLVAKKYVDEAKAICDKL